LDVIKEERALKRELKGRGGLEVLASIKLNKSDGNFHGNRTGSDGKQKSIEIC
jgi:hypothetical protein